MTAVLLGQILGLSFACGLNLYLTVAVLGILSRLQVIQALPPGLHGLEGLIVIASAAILYLVEAVIDKVRHADSLWDTVHTLIRPPAAALLALGILWGHSASLAIPAAAIAFGVALTAHATKGGIRLALNASLRGGRSWFSVFEDALAVVFATLAFVQPTTALLATAAVLLVLLLAGPRYWRAFRLGYLALSAWRRTLFSSARWRDADELPRRVRRTLEPTPLGSAPPRGTRAAVYGLPGVGAYRNGWLVLTTSGPTFIYRTALGVRSIALPSPRDVQADPGVWADILRIEADDDLSYTLFMLKDGPALDLTVPHLRQAEQ